MSDYGAVTNLLAKIAWKVDHEELDDFGDVWFEDATLIYVDVDGNRTECHGIGDILTLIKTSYKPPSAPCLHIVTTPNIDFNGDEARARYYTVHTLHGPDARPCGVGEYETITRRDAKGQWRVAKLTQIQRLSYLRVPGA